MTTVTVVSTLNWKYVNRRTKSYLHMLFLSDMKWEEVKAMSKWEIFKLICDRIDAEEKKNGLL